MPMAPKTNVYKRVDKTCYFLQSLGCSNHTPASVLPMVVCSFTQKINRYIIPRANGNN